MSEELLVWHCAPTLAGMKTGNLFSCKYTDTDELEQQINRLNRMLNPKGVMITLMRKGNHTALIYVYRPKQLQKAIFNADAAKFLSQNGYTLCSMEQCSIEQCLRELSRRISEGKTFPHEIGLFLGYPLPDVRAFIENKGANSKCVGCWTVYSDEYTANKTFDKYKKCTKIYRQKYLEGSSILRLTVGV